MNLPREFAEDRNYLRAVDILPLAALRVMSPYELLDYYTQWKEDYPIVKKYAMDFPRFRAYILPINWCIVPTHAVIAHV